MDAPAPMSPKTRPALPKVCIVGELPPPNGGMALQAERLTNNLRAEGHSVLNLRTNLLARDSLLRHIKVLGGLLNFLLFLGSVFVTVPRVQVVHVFSHSYLSFLLFTVAPAACARLLGRRLVIHYHGGAAASFLDHWGRLVVPVLRLSHSLIVPSDYLVEVFRTHGLMSLVVPNTVCMDKFTFVHRQPLQPRVLMARHLAYEYNPACGIRAFARVARVFGDATLTIAGDGPLRSELEALCATLGVSQQVYFLGNVDSKRMLEAFDSAHIFLNSSRVDNQPVSMLEALACGLPVVSTAVGGIPFMVTNGEDALLAGDDDDASLADHILRLLAEPELAARLVERGHLRVRSFDWPAVYPLWAAQYAGGSPP